MSEVVTVQDIGFTLMMSAATAELPDDCNMEPIAECNLSTIGEILHRMRPHLSKSVKHFHSKEPDCEQLYSLVENLIQAIDNRHDGLGTVFSPIAVMLKEYCIPNVDKRTRVRRLFELLTDMSYATAPASLDAAIDGFKIAATRPHTARRPSCRWLLMCLRRELMQEKLDSR